MTWEAADAAGELAPPHRESAASAAPPHLYNMGGRIPREGPPQSGVPGVNPENTGLLPRYDWYSATLRSWKVHPLDMLRSLRFSASVEATHGRFGYTAGSVARDGGGRTLATVLYGAETDHCNMTSSGFYAPDLREYLLEMCPAHEVTRVDSCLDFSGDFDALADALVRIARRRGIKLSQAGDWQDGFDPSLGRTLYLGGTSSPVRVRLYEKGKQLGQVEGVAADPRWLRCEVQYRPESRLRKAAAASLDPSQVWCVSPFAREIFGLITGSDAQAVKLPGLPEPTAIAALRHCAIQYEAAMAEVASRFGGYEAVWDFILRVQHAEKVGSSDHVQPRDAFESVVSPDRLFSRYSVADRSDV